MNINRSASQLLAAFAFTLIAAPQPACAQLPTSQTTHVTENPSSIRFDEQLRDDFFAGMTGDQKSFDRAIKLCEDTLAKNPRHAQAMVWHGSGLLYTSGQAFHTGDVAKGLDLWQRGLKEMDAAVALEPDNISVLVPRGATLIPTSKYTPDSAEAKRLLQIGVADYEKVLSLQKSIFGKLSIHSRGELLFGLADGWYRLGDLNKSRQYLRQITSDCANSAYASQAESWLATTDPKALREKSNSLSCIGCHTK